MTNHIGETVTIADPYLRGPKNDHVEVLCSSVEGPETYSAFARSEFNAAGGPRPIPSDSDLLFRMKSADHGSETRGWGHVDTI